MATFQVCQPTGWTGLAVAWGVVRSVVGFPDAGTSGGDYLGGFGLPSLARFVIGTARYVDNHGLPLCGWGRTCGGVLLISDSDGRGSTEHEGLRAGSARRMNYCGRAALAGTAVVSASSALRRVCFSPTA